MSPYSLEVTGQVQIHSHQPLLPPHRWLPGPGCLLVDRGTWQLFGKEVTLEPRILLPGKLWEEQLRGPAGPLLPCPCHLGQAWINHGLNISHREPRAG